jgi:hypothetical protein
MVNHMNQTGTSMKQQKSEATATRVAMNLEVHVIPVSDVPTASTTHVGLSTSKILSDGSGDIEPPRRRAILPRPEGQGLTRHLVSQSQKTRAKLKLPPLVEFCVSYARVQRSFDRISFKVQ